MTKPRDELLERYADAVAQDPRRPSDHVRHAARAHAQMLRDQAAAVRRVENGPTSRPAANLPQWQLSLVASLAVVGLVGLLYVQIDRGPVEDRDLALGIPAPGPLQRAEPLRADAPPNPQPKVESANSAAIALRKVAPTGTQARPLRNSAEEVAEIASTSTDSTAADLETKPSLANKATEELARARAPVAAMPKAAPAPVPAPSLAPVPATRAIPPPPPSEMRSARESSGSNPAMAQFLDAVQSGRVDTVQSMLRNGIAINTRFDNSSTALMLAVVHQQAQVVQLLLNLGADTALVNQQGLTALQIANQLGYADMARLLTQAP